MEKINKSKKSWYLFGFTLKKAQASKSVHQSMYGAEQHDKKNIDNKINKRKLLSLQILSRKDKHKGPPNPCISLPHSTPLKEAICPKAQDKPSSGLKNQCVYVCDVFKPVESYVKGEQAKNDEFY